MRSHAFNATDTFTAFGLTISSAIHFPELLPATGAPDITVSYGHVPVELPHAKDRGPGYQATSGQFLMDVDGVARFLVRHGNEIVIDPLPGAGDDDIRLFLLGSAFGALLHQRGNLVLHGSTVKVEGGCVVFLGRSGTGKSTLAAVLGRKGYRSLGDDVCVISIGQDGVPYASPSYPQAKLWVDTLQRLGIDETGLRRVRPSRPKRAVPIEGAWDHAPLPVKRVYVLSPGWLKLDPVLQPIRGSARFRVLRDYTYRVEFLHGLDMTRQHFKLAAQLASRLPVIRVVRAADAFVAEELAAVVEHDFRAANPVY